MTLVATNTHLSTLHKLFQTSLSLGAWVCQSVLQLGKSSTGDKFLEAAEFSLPSRPESSMAHPLPGVKANGA